MKNIGLRWKKKSVFGNKKIGVLMGGTSSEREISLITGGAISAALKKLNYHVVDIDLKGKISEALQENKVDVIFNALHGRFGEDGVVQSVLEDFKIPYTGSGVVSSALGMAKAFTKDVFCAHGIVTPHYDLWFTQNEPLQTYFKKIKMEYPLIVKPEGGGSTIGMTIVHDPKNMKEALESAAQYDKVVMVEKFIEGREITGGVLNGEALPLIEIRPKSGFYDYESKYTKGKTEYLCPAPISRELTEKIQRQSVFIFEKLRCRGCARSDFIVSKSDEIFFLEINTLPGMTATSLVPKAAAQMGLSFEELVEQILNTATLDYV